jgi:peptidoglycan-associated lipoprotein
MRQRLALVVLGIAVANGLIACAGRRFTAEAVERVTEPPIAPLPAGQQPSVPPALAPSVAQVSLSDVYFDFDQFLIRHDAAAVLGADARQLMVDGTQTILIEGHCDERGTLAYNLVLGERRARAVRQYLQDLGVPASEMQIISYGKERPFCTEPSEACWQSNRRAHFRQP